MMNEAAMRVEYYKLEDEENVIRDRTLGLYRDRELLTSKIQPLELQLKKVHQAIAKIERPALSNILNQKAMIARALKNKIGVRPTGV